MFDHFHAIRRKRMNFTIHGSRVDYMVRCIWILMQVHMVMEEFTANVMKLMIRPVTGHVTASEPHDIADARSSTPPKYDSKHKLIRC